MTAEPPGHDDTPVASRLAALDEVPTTDQLGVYTAIAAELASRLDHPDQPDHADGARGLHVDAADLSGGTSG